MDDQENERKMQVVLFYMLHIAFIEIRASESLNAAKKFADIFHNIPLMLNQSRNSQEDQKVYETLVGNAKRYGMEGYIDQLKVMALKNISQRG